MPGFALETETGPKLRGSQSNNVKQVMGGGCWTTRSRWRGGTTSALVDIRTRERSLARTERQTTMTTTTAPLVAPRHSTRARRPRAAHAPAPSCRCRPRQLLPRPQKGKACGTPQEKRPQKKKKKKKTKEGRDDVASLATLIRWGPPPQPPGPVFDTCRGPRSEFQHACTVHSPWVRYGFPIMQLTFLGITFNFLFCCHSHMPKTQRKEKPKREGWRGLLSSFYYYYFYFN